MPRYRQAADEDTVAVMVPRQDKPLAPVTAARAGRLRAHLVKTLGEMSGQECAAPTSAPPATGFVARVSATACSLCKGWCCRNGGDDAYLDQHTLARTHRDRPELDAEALMQVYLDRVPAIAYVSSCIFHANTGCTLGPSLRADICNSYFCGGLAAFLEERHRESPTVVIAGEGDAMRTSKVLVP